MIDSGLRELTIEHLGTREQVTLPVYHVSPKEVEVKWPLYGLLRFNARTGQGLGRNVLWRLEAASLREVHQVLGIKETTMGKGK